jgi:hypothetical protein
MTGQAIFNALCYELGLFLIRKRPSLALHPWVKMLMAWCRPDWAAWKAEHTLRVVDRQAKDLVEQWEAEHRHDVSEKLAHKAQKLFPEAKITPLPNAVVPSMMIEHQAPPDASDAVKALGGEMRITWTLDGQPPLVHGQ